MENIKINKKANLIGSLISLAAIAVLAYFSLSGTINNVYDQSLSLNLGKAITCLVVFLMVLFFDPHPSEVSMSMKLRITLVIIVGGSIFGMCGWSLIAPSTNHGIISFVGGSITAINAMLLLAMAFATGYFTSTLTAGYDGKIAVSAVPVGLCICAVRGGYLTNYLSRFDEVQDMHRTYMSLSWESIYWISLVLVGILGAKLAERFAKGSTEKGETAKNKALIVMVPLLVSLLIAYFGINILALAPRVFDQKFFTVLHQPLTGQIGFAVFITFVLAGYVCRHFIKSSYIYPLISSAIACFIFMNLSGNIKQLEYMNQKYASVFVAQPFAAILPIQFIAFGSLGAICGYWMSFLHEKWKLENQQQH